MNQVTFKDRIAVATNITEIPGYFIVTALGEPTIEHRAVSGIAGDVSIELSAGPPASINYRIPMTDADFDDQGVLVVKGASQSYKA